MMRQELFNAAVAAIRRVDGVQHVDLWNQNVEFLEQEQPWPMPAVFIEFTPIEWTASSGRALVWTGRGEMRLHIVTQWNGPEDVRGWDLGERIHLELEGMSGRSYHGVALSGTITNHNHEDIVEDIEVYKFKGERRLINDD